MVRIAQESVTHSDNLIWEPLHIEGAEGEAFVKVLGRDEENGARTALVKYEAGFKHPKRTSRSYADIYVLEGEITDGDKTLRRGAYQYRPTGTEFGTVESSIGCVRFVRTGGIDDTNCSPDEILIPNAEWDDWQSHPTFSAVHLIKVLRQDEAAQLHLSLIMGYKEGMVHDSTQWHDHGEEVFVISGGEFTAYEGDVEGRYLLSPRTYIARQPYKSRHGFSYNVKPPVLMMAIRGGWTGSLEEYAGKDSSVTPGMPKPTFSE